MSAVRAFRAADAEGVSAMMRELNLHEGYDPQAAPSPEALLRNFLGPERRGAILLAEAGGAMAGFVSVLPTFNTVNGHRGAYLGDVYVRAAWRRRGLGRALMAAAARLAAAEGGGAFLWWTTLPKNPAARAFYEALGAAEEVLHAHTLDGAAFARLAGPAP